MSDLHLDLDLDLQGDPQPQSHSPTSSPSPPPPLDQGLQQEAPEEEEAPPTPRPRPQPPLDQLEFGEQERDPPSPPQVSDASDDLDEGEDEPAPQPDVAAVPELPTSVAEVLQPMPKPQGRARKKPVRTNAKQRAVADQRLERLRQNSFHPVPFMTPSSTLDLSKHELLLRALGLWDFAHLALDRDPLRQDLLMELIAYYDPQRSRSLVRDLQIRVSLADIRRALELPPSCKKEKAGPSACGTENNADPCLEVYSREESIAAIEEFMSTFVLFQFQEDDACILPPEVASVHQMVKEGQPHKVDWPKFVCSLVKKELAEIPNHGRYYYASHLQRLIKCQKPALFEDVDVELKPELVPEEVNSVEVPMAEEEEDDELDDMEDSLMAKSMDEINDMETAGDKTGLCLGVGVHVGVIDDTTSEHCDEGEDEQWLQEDKSVGLNHCLQRCNSSLAGSMEFENLSREEDGEVRAEERNADGLSAKFGSFEGLTSMDLLQSLDAVHAPYGQPGNSVDIFPGEYLAARDSQKNMTLNSPTGGSFFYENNGKRPLTEGAPEEDENMHQFSQTNQQKRMRMNDIWEHSPSNFDACMDQVQSVLAKAKLLHVEKMQESINAQLQLQYMGEVIQEKDQIIGSLEKARMEEQQKWQLQICRLDHEVNVLADLAFGYKKALMQTRASFAEYRRKFPQGDEPLYKDADGTGGLVLSVKELELLRMQKDEEMRHKAELAFNELEMQWLPKFEELKSKVSLFDGLIEVLVLEFKTLQERFRKMKQ